MSEQEIEQHVIDLICGISGVSEDTLLKAFDEIDKYKTWRKKKKSGNGFRLIAEPAENLKKFQRGLLKTLNRLQKRREYYIKNNDCLPYSVRLGEMCKNISFAQHGGLKKKSTSTLIREHIWTNAHFVIKVDLKKAFPHAGGEMVQELFNSLFKEEINFLHQAMVWRSKLVKHLLVKSDYDDLRRFYYEKIKLERDIKRQYPRYTLFPTTKVPRFRSLLRELHSKNLDFNESDVVEIISRASLYLSGLVVRAGSIPQGAPTSSMILNILLTRRGLFSFLATLFPRSNVTVYTDDIIISTMNRPTVDQINQMVEKMRNIGFPYNPKKLYIFDLRKTSAYVLGMKLVKRSTPEAEVLLKKGSPGFKHPRGFARANRIKKDWYATHATLPKDLQKRYRACFYQACHTIGFSQEFFDTALGYHGHIVSTYGWPTQFMPASLKTVVQDFRDKFYLKGESILPKDNSRKRKYSEKTIKKHQLIEAYRKQFQLLSDPNFGFGEDLPF